MGPEEFWFTGSLVLRVKYTRTGFRSSGATIVCGKQICLKPGAAPPVRLAIGSSAFVCVGSTDTHALAREFVRQHATRMWHVFCRPVFPERHVVPLLSVCSDDMGVTRSSKDCLVE